MSPLTPQLIAKWIMNMSLINGIIASEWKTSIIRPLLKKLIPVLILLNYRPVSNLPFFKGPGTICTKTI